MSQKIIGVTVGTPTPRANLKQTDPRKADYVKGKDIIPEKVSQLENDAGYLTEHQDISGKLDASKLSEAIDNALAQAKASGEFDGENGKPGDSGVHVGSSTPTNGANVWIDTGGTQTGMENWTFTLDDGSTVTKAVFVG